VESSRRKVLDAMKYRPLHFHKKLTFTSFLSDYSRSNYCHRFMPLLKTVQFLYETFLSAGLSFQNIWLDGWTILYKNSEFLTKITFFPIILFQF